MAIQRFDNLRGRTMPVEDGLATESGLQTGHEKSGGDSFAANVGDRETKIGIAKLEEIVIVTGDDARSTADRGEFETGERRKFAGEKLSLHLAGDGEFVFEAVAGALLLDEFGDGTGHGVERFCKDAELIAIADINAVREIAQAHVARSRIKVVDGDCDGTGEHDTSDEGCNFQGRENDGDQNQSDHERIAEGSQ